MNRKGVWFCGSLVILSTLAAGCGGGGSSSTPPTPTPKPTSTAKPTTAPSATAVPSMAASPTATPTAISGGATATLQFTSGLVAGAKSVVVAFPAAPPADVALPAGCQASAPCTVTVPAQVGGNVAFTVTVYPLSNETGTPIAIASPSAPFVAAQNTTVPVALEGVMDSYTLSVSRLVSQIASNLGVGILARDATGALLTAPYLTTTYQVPSFDFTLTDTAGTVTSIPYGFYAYSGFGPNPSFVTVSISGYPNASKPVPITSPLPGVVGYALQPSLPVRNLSGPTPGPLQLFQMGAKSLLRSYAINDLGSIFFDHAGTIWMTSPGQANSIVGIKADGTLVGPIVGVPSVHNAIFGVDGTLYLTSESFTEPPGTFVDAYSLDSHYNATTVRAITVNAACTNIAVDPLRNIYVGCDTGLLEFGAAAGNGAIPPLASNPNANDPVIDSAGNLYALYGTAQTGYVIGVWPSGTFGPNAPSRTLPIPSGAGSGSAELGIDGQDNVYIEASDSIDFGDGFKNYLYYYPAGSATPQQLFPVPVGLTQESLTLAVPF